MRRAPDFNHLCFSPSGTAGDTETGRHYSGLREMKAVRFGSGAGVAGTDPGQSLVEVEKIPPMFVSHHLPFD